MTEKPNPSGLPTTRQKYMLTFKAEYVRQVAAGARQTNVPAPKVFRRLYWAVGSTKRGNKPCQQRRVRHFKKVVTIFFQLSQS